MQSLGRLRALTRAPIHLMSGDDDVRRDALLLGATGFLKKPFDIHAIFALIDALPERSP
jgi:DNA-binding response OmpR family regulator